MISLFLLLPRWNLDDGLKKDCLKQGMNDDFPREKMTMKMMLEEQKMRPKTSKLEVLMKTKMKMKGIDQMGVCQRGLW